MRIWSVHPKYLDTKGLVALWRESLLAKNVLEGKTKAYLNHPQLIRFKAINNPIAGINRYLSFVYNEAISRQYNFNKEKIDWDFENVTLAVTKGQLKYEKIHLLNKLSERDKDRYEALKDIDNIETHPLFRVVEGVIEEWEIIKDKNTSMKF